MSYKTDNEWEKWGQSQPWYGVLSEKKYQGKTLDTTVKQQFYKTGVQHVAKILSVIHQLDPAFKPKHAVDFGCGTGRLLFAFAKKARHATGIDISASMIREAKKSQPKDTKNVSYIHGDSSKLPSKKYDLVHSFIVFQHMDTRRGYEITDRLLKNLESGGFAALQYKVHDSSSTFLKMVRLARRKSKLVNYAVNLYKKRPLTTPNMQMNMYDLGILTEIFHRNGIQDFRILSDHPSDCYVGATLIGQKK